MLSQIKPEIIHFQDAIGNVIQYTGVSNMTHISNKKNVLLGKNIFIGHFNYIDGYKKVKIGDGCQITNYVSILTHSSHHSLRLQGYERNLGEELKDIGLQTGDVELGEFTYVGAHTVIMPGSKLGKGCIVSAFSYVNGEFPDYSILRGQPARIIGNTKEIDESFLNQYPDLKKYYYNPV